ncbi:HEAT repeat domain-containing protein [Candidatus Micrarchaeota archaeon]|nr:HEAT repeat domain-containing protein [Candidatus Micrarchaeota archaeon]
MRQKGVFRRMGDKYRGWRTKRLLKKGKIETIIRKEKIDFLIDTLKDKNWKVKWGAVSALYKIVHQAVGHKPDFEVNKIMDSLIGALGDENYEVRNHSIWALVNITSFNLPETDIKVAEIVDGLVGALKDEDCDVRKYAAGALEKIMENNTNEIKSMIIEKLTKYVQSYEFYSSANKPSEYNPIYKIMEDLMRKQENESAKRV